MKIKSDSAFFEKEVTNRNIERLLHFTSIGNLYSIFEQGCIFSRSDLEKLEQEEPSLDLWDYVSTNDKIRLDKLPAFVNTSVQDVNHPLLERFRSRIEGSPSSLCIFCIKKELIWWHDTLFSVGNAASKNSKNIGIDGSLERFKQLFTEQVRGGLRPNQPTDIQAEVLIKNKIPLSSVQSICFEAETDMVSAKGAATMIYSEALPEFFVDESMFKIRG